jgi:hypothetical protein
MHQPETEQQARRAGEIPAHPFGKRGGGEQRIAQGGDGACYAHGDCYSKRAPKEARDASEIESGRHRRREPCGGGQDGKQQHGIDEMRRQVPGTPGRCIPRDVPEEHEASAQHRLY